MDLDTSKKEIVLPDLVWDGIDLFNAQRYFDAHEVLEAAWRAEPKPVRKLYQGILQAGIAYHHLRLGNQIGALKLLDRALTHLRPWSELTSPVNIKDLIQNLLFVRAILQEDQKSKRFQEIHLKPLLINRKS